MPILERTPPRRLAQVGAGDALVASSPSRLKPTPSPLRGGVGADSSFVFPSLDALAAPHRERNAALKPAICTPPALVAHRQTSSNVTNGVVSRVGSASANSRKVGGASGGRNGPTLSNTASKQHELQVHRKRDSNSARLESRSPSRDTADEGQRFSCAAPKDQSPATCMYPSLPTPSALAKRSDGAKTTLHNIDDLFEAQIQRALASGANPFQDRKRDEMRGESRTTAGAFLEAQSPTPTQVRPSLSADESLGRSVGIPMDGGSTFRIARVSRPASPSLAQERPVVQRGPSKQQPSEGDASPDEEVQQLRAQVKKESQRLQEVQAEAARTVKQLEEKEQHSITQGQRIKELEGRVSQWKAKAKETSSSPVEPVALAWEALRVRCKDGITRASEARERDVEVVICRNEVTYMDARKREGELGRVMMQAEVKGLRGASLEANEQCRLLRSELHGVKRERDEAEKIRRSLEAGEVRLRDTLRAEEGRSSALEEKVRELSQSVSETGEQWHLHSSDTLLLPKLAEEKKLVYRLKQRQISSPARPTIASEARKVSPTRREVQSKGEWRAPPTAPLQRQSPRKKPAVVSALSSAAPMPSAEVSFEGANVRPGTMDTNDDGFSSPPAAIKEGRARSVKGKVQSKNAEQEREKPKKASILSRAKKAAPKATGKANTHDEEQQEQQQWTEPDQREISRDVQQTPMIPARKKRSHREEEHDEGHDSTLNATPFVPAKTTKGRAKKPGAEEASKTMPLLPVNTNTADELAPERKKKRRLLKQNSNVANGFLNCNGDAEGDLDPKLNLPLQLSPIKPSDQHGPTIGGRGAAAAASNRIFGR